ncbi:hypothetical protein NM688_g2211 [Phlebia brevispora]|uniref:Uncharacterized protein n=1 Tax=Phlebia brevispora TaxID=194682 RepID=A0ACC1T9Y5_9APHY|nr:hypothetical protein NM688_g2211 [Phlebia brevispora]
MCKFRRVRNVYSCGHGITLPEEEIRCDSEKCKFSPNHPATCVPPQCLRTCWQYHQFPELYSPHIDALCPTCAAAQ